MTNILIKKDIIKNLSFKTGFSASFSKKLINDLINILVVNVSTNGLILKNIGKFKVIKKKERLGRNPKTKEKFIITERKTVSFNASKKLQDKLN